MLFSRGLFRFVTFVFAVSLALNSYSQTQVRYAGRPFVRISQANANDPIAGFISGFGRAQLLGNAVHFIPTSGPNALGVFSGRGGPLAKLAGPGDVIAGNTLQLFHAGFARDTGPDGITFVAGSTFADSLYRIDGANRSLVLASGAALPNSNGKLANVLGEPFYAGGNLAVIAWHALPNGGGVDFRGVYRVVDGALQPISDTATALPGGFGIPDGYSSQLGFDGQTIAFWASRGAFTENEGMFAKTGAGEVVMIARNGDAFPGGGTIDGFISPPFVSAGVVYFFAFDSSSNTRLLKYDAGALTVLAADGNATPSGALQGLGQYGLAAEAGKVFFPARAGAGAGLFAIENGALQTIIAPGSNVGGIVPSAIVLQDAANDTLVLEVSSGSARRLVANLAEPAPPVIVSDLAPASVPPGARVELRIQVLGDAPIVYSWKKNGVTIPDVTGDTFIIESATANDIASYRVDISNAFGSTFSASVLVNVQVPPAIVSLPASYTIEVGDPLTIVAVTGGGLPQTFSWTRDGTPVTSESPAIGYFVRNSATLADAGRYVVTVSNEWGSATGETVVTVNPAGPNPIYNGKRFVKILDKDTLVPGTETKFGTSELSETSARFEGDRVIFTGKSAANAPLGIFAWDAGNLVRLIAAGAALPNGLGAAHDFWIVTALPTEPVVIRALQMINNFAQPVGVYRLNGENLEVIVDTTTPVPSGNGALFPNPWGEGMFAAGKYFFTETIQNTPSAYLWQNGALSRLLRANDSLPVVGTAATFLQSLANNGTDFALVASTSGQAQMAALQLNAAGQAAKIIARDETHPALTSPVRTFGPIGTDGSNFYLTIFDTAFARHFFSWNGSVLTRLLSVQMEVPNLGAIQSLDTSYPKAANGKLYSAARVRVGTANQNGIVAATAGNVEPVLFAAKLDGRRVAAIYPIDANGDRVLAMVQFADNTRGLYANLGAVEEELRLNFAWVNATTIRFNVPDGTILESAATPDGAYETAPSNEITIISGNRFFRLRR